MNQIINKLSPDNIIRCIDCNLISSLELNYNEGIASITFECENNHKGNILLKDYMTKYNKYALSKEKCGICDKNQKEFKEDFYYCNKCKIFLCGLCKHNHNEDKNDIIPYKKYDFICKIHSSLYSFYCINCKKNLCINCQVEHKNHDMIDLSKFNYNQESIRELEEKINIFENKINNLNDFIQNFINEINKIKESSELEMEFLKLLLYSYQYEENQNSLNYNIIQNLKNYEKNFISQQINLLSRLNEKGTKFIFLLQYFEKNKKVNPFKFNFQIFNDASGPINQVDILKDGRLISCSNSLKIFNKYTYENQLSICKSKNINSFTELKDGRIIICYEKIMEIIKLIEDNKYQITEIINGHSELVYKVIEIKENELISISYDKIMKIWKLNNDNKFENITNIYFQNSKSQCDIFKLNKNEFVTLSIKDKNIKFWNSNNYSYITTINNIQSNFGLKLMCLLDNDTLCVGGDNYKGFYLIKISTYQLINNIIGPKRICCINKCFDNLILCSIINQEGNYCLTIYKYGEYNLIKIYEKVNAHEQYIYSCIELNDGIIVSGGYDHLIKFWSN